MNKFKVSFDKFRYSSKPKGYDISSIKERIAHNVRHTDRSNIKSFVQLVGSNGCTFCPATFKQGILGIEYFEQMQILVLDFDNGISFETVKDRADQYNLPILFVYDTFSSVAHNKFSVVFLNDIPIPDIKAVEIQQNALVTIFPEANNNSNDVTQICFGGKNLIYFDESIPAIDIESLIRNMSLYLKNEYGDTNYKRKIAEFAKNNDIALNKNKMLDISVVENTTEHVNIDQFNKISPSTIILYKSFDENLLNQYYLINLNSNCINNCSAGNKNYKTHAPYRSSTLNDINCSCQLFKEFETGRNRLHDNELMGIATNIIQVESGIKKFINILQVNSYYADYPDKYTTWNYYLNYFKQNEHKPISCNLFCPYKDKCEHSTDILSTAKPKYHTMGKLVNYKEHFYSIEEAEKDLEQSISRAIEAADNLFHIIKAQIAIGKTETYLNLMKSSSGKWLIAVPTNILKHEIFRRAICKGLNIIETPSLDEIKDKMPDKIWMHINNLYQSGKYHLVNPYIEKTLIEQNIPCLKEYLKKLKECENFDGHVITTHKRLQNLDVRILRKYDVIIIDEDILYNSIIPNQCEIPISDLIKIAAVTTNSELANKIKKVLQSVKTKQLFTIPSVKWNDKENEIQNDDISTLIDIPSFCLAERFCYRKASEEKSLKEDSVAFLKLIKFKNVKYIMVSATVDEAICNYFFGRNRIKFYNCKKTRYTGSLYQYSDKSMTRTCIDENPGIIEQIRKWSGNKHFITFKKYDDGDLHFGNAIGSDNLAGKNLDVIGTPYQAEFLYKLFAYTIGLYFDQDAKMKHNNMVTHNGYKFRFTTYDYESLRNIHFWMIESELEQAVGRARLLRHNCRVNLFSNFPLSQAVLKEAEYEKLF